jgi:NAD(P)H-dependent FMN reductase
VAARAVPAYEAMPADLLDADLVVLAAPENLGALSGAMKEYLDTGYYDWLDRTNGKPWASIIAAGSDGSGAQRQLDRIATGLRLRRVAEPLIVITDAQSPERIRATKTVKDTDLARARELGAALASGLALGIF